MLQMGLYSGAHTSAIELKQSDLEICAHADMDAQKTRAF
jgi:hypothetical protein